MSDVTASTNLHTPTEARRAPISLVGPVAWMPTNPFANWWSTAITLALIYLIIRTGIGFIDWAFVNAIWSVPVSPQGVANTEACREVKGVGACWASSRRSTASSSSAPIPMTSTGGPWWSACFSSASTSSRPCGASGAGSWRADLAAVLTAIGVLMWGGILGLTHVPQERWGGLPITLILATSWPRLRLPGGDPWRSAGVPGCRRSRRSASFTSS